MAGVTWDNRHIFVAIAAELTKMMLLLIDEEEEEEEEESSRPAKVRRCRTTDLFLEKEGVWGQLLEAIDGEGPDDQIHDFLRLNREEFLHILSLIGPKICREDTNMRKAITPKQRLAIALRFLATGDSYVSLAHLFRVSNQSVSLIVREVCSVLAQDLKEYVKIDQDYPASGTTKSKKARNGSPRLFEVVVSKNDVMDWDDRYDKKGQDYR
uniref:Transposase Helix-turn-helix domain-containing protein n=1 Tax=Anopheles culicifacies TaxID=139723 RepID=A0A182MTC5_9DIPT